MSEVPPSRDMAEEGKQHTPGLKTDEADPAACDELTPTDPPATVKQQSSDVSDSSPPSLISEAKNDDGKTVEQDVENGDSEEKKTMPPIGQPSVEDDSRENSRLHEADKENHGDHSGNEEQPVMAEATPDGDSAVKTMAPPTGKSSVEHDSEENCMPHGADKESHGDNKRKEEQPAGAEATTGEDSEEGNKPSAATNLPNSGDRQDDQADGSTATNDKEPSATNQTNTGAGQDKEKPSASEKVKDASQSTTSTETASSQNESLREESDHQKTDVEDIETIGPIIQDIAEPKVPGGIGRYLAAVCIVVFVAILVQRLLQPESPPQKKDVRQIDVFLKQMEKVKTGFPHQRAELWNRSRIHLQRHLLTAQPTEPVSLILTAGLRAERTLHCLAQGLASAFSAALNASVLHIDGASKASEDSDQVKLDIDSKLQGAFEGDKPVAVIHRFEELPPGSTLIFYRYCDHENAAYKKTFLIFTVLLGEEEEIPAKIHLSAVEEMVDDHLQKKFLTHGHPVSFDRMDLDKYGGLWSRISHLILPVAAEDRIEHEGC